LLHSNTLLLQIYPEIFPSEQLDAAQKVLQALLKIDLVSTLEAVSSAMYCHLGGHDVQLWGCVSLQEIMWCTRHRRGLLQHLAQHVDETYEQWEQAILGKADGNSVDKIILRNLFDEMDVNKDGKVRLSAWCTRANSFVDAVSCCRSSLNPCFDCRFQGMSFKGSSIKNLP